MTIRWMLVGLSVLALVIAGQGGGGAPSALSAPAAAPVGQAAQPVRGGTLRMSEPRDVDSLDPVRPGNRVYALLVSDPLVSIGDDGKVNPELAESWERSPDHTTITLRLRRGVKFHNGREMTADDVAFNIKRIRDDLRVITAVRPLMGLISDIRVVDPSTLSVKFSEPLANAMDVFELVYVIAPETAAELTTKIVSTGPFKLVEYVPGSHLRYGRNPDYWKRGRPLLDEVVHRVIGDPEAQVLSLEGGAADLIGDLPSQAYGRLARGNRFRTGAGAPGFTVGILLFNVKQKPFDDRRVRQAISHAIDRRRIVDTVLGSGLETYCLPYPSHSYAYDPEQSRLCRYSPQQAKELLGRAGYQDGFETALTASKQFELEFRMAEIIQANLGAVGIRARIETLEAGAIVANVRAGRFQLMPWGYMQATKDPSTMFLSTMVWRPDRNLSQFSSPDYERLIKESASTIDQAKRKSLFRQLNRIILTENFVLPIGPEPRWFAHRPQVQDVKWNREAKLILTDTWIAR